VTSQATIDQVARWTEAEFGRLDILVNNAGIFIDDAPPSGLHIEGLRRTYDINVFGPVAVTKAMLPLLPQSSAVRIVNMSSGLSSLTLTSDPGWEFADLHLLAYSSSKTALNAMTVQLAKELRDTPIKVNAADPGYTATDLNNHQGAHSVEQGARAAVRLATLPADGPTGGFFDEDGTLPMHVALKGSRVLGVEFGTWYYYLRPIFQPIFMFRALFASGVIWPREAWVSGE
jgi:NAD(P)-dependent dehydrogenase (short-subunit alcohol dehydrogenase family)